MNTQPISAAKRSFTAKGAILGSLPLTAYLLAGLGFSVAPTVLLQLGVTATVLSMALATFAAFRLNTAQASGLDRHPSFAEEVAGGVLIVATVLLAAGVASLAGDAWTLTSLVVATATFVALAIAEFVISMAAIMLAGKCSQTGSSNAIYAIAIAVQQKLGGPLGEPLKP